MQQLEKKPQGKKENSIYKNKVQGLCVKYTIEHIFWLRPLGLEDGFSSDLR